MSEVFNEDCMVGMARYPDKYFDLAIVDPEYGIGEGKRDSYHPGASTRYKPKNWDSKVPDQSYFKELFRVSKNQIIWGGNYFQLPVCKKPIVWDKQQPEGIDQAMFEYAWQSQDNQQARIFRRSPSADKNCVSNGDSRGRQTKMRIHPCQKPVALYKWLFKHYGKIRFRCIDTHLGSGSSRIAADDMAEMELEFVGFELDKDYFEASVKRYNQYKSQINMFA